MPFEPREAGPRGVAASRLPWLMAAALGVAIGILLILGWHELFDLLRRHTSAQAELAVCIGVFAGLFVSRMDVHSVERRRGGRLERLYLEVAGTTVAQVPGYTHYLPCAFLQEDLATANLTARLRGAREKDLLDDARPGLLFVGPAGLRFEPRGRAPARPPIEMGPVRQVTAVPLALPQPRVARLAGIRPQFALHLRWPSGQAIFAVPAIGDTVPRLHACLDTLRWGPVRAGR